MDNVLESKILKCLELVTRLFELQEMLIKITFLVLAFEYGNSGKRREKKRQKIG